MSDKHAQKIIMQLDMINDSLKHLVETQKR